MIELDNIKSQTTWNDAAQDLNQNFDKIAVELEKLKNATVHDKGYFSTEGALVAAFPTASTGSRAFVGYTAPFAVYVWDDENREWVNSGETVDSEPEVNLGDYYTKEEIDTMSVFLTENEWNDLEESGAVEDKLYFIYEE